MEELIDFADGSRGLVYSLEKNFLSAILLEETATLAAGTPVYLTGQRLSILVGDALLGRVIDPLGTPLDGNAAPDCASRREVESLSHPLWLVNSSTSRSTPETKLWTRSYRSAKVNAS